MAPSANLGVTVPGLASVVLNKQASNPDGSLTVTAVSIRASTSQSIDIASVTCVPHIIDDKPVTPAPTPTGSGNNLAHLLSAGFAEIDLAVHPVGV